MKRRDATLLKRREMQQLKDLERLIKQQGIQDSALTERYKEMYKWNAIIRQMHNIDILERELVSPIDSHVDNGEVVFQRVLERPEMQCNEKWEDVSQCYMCNKFQRVSIEMHGEHQAGD